MSAYGLMKCHHAIQTAEAWKDFRALAERAMQAGRLDLVEKYKPPEGSGWRVVDRCSARLRKELEPQS